MKKMNGKLTHRSVNALIFFFFASLAVLLYWPWFTSGFISYGDWWHNLPARVLETYQHFLIWDGASGIGAPLGAGFGNNIILYWVAWLYGGLLSILHLDVSVSVRLVWFVPYVLMSFFGSWYLGRTISSRRLVAVVMGVVYPLSTFAELDIQGGHMTIALAYVVAPLILACLIRLLRDQSYKAAILLGSLLALQAVYDIRISYITILIVLFYLVYYGLFDLDRGQAVAKKLKLLGLAVLIGLALSSYWLLTVFFVQGSGQLPASYDSVLWLKTLSYAKLPNTLFGNHVWWPWSEGGQMPINALFGVSVLLAIAALKRVKEQRVTVFFLALYIGGVFLAKGVNPPLGDTYAWLFQHVPGFSFFRDPAKFFTLVMMGLAPLVGLGAVVVVDWLRPRWRRLGVVIILTLLLWPTGKIIFAPRHGTFVTKHLPTGYSQLADWLDRDKTWGRILWMPVAQRYIPASQTHPVVDYNVFSKADWATFSAIPNQPATLLAHPYSRWLLQHNSVRYLGVPADSENEIYQYFGSEKSWRQAVATFTKATPTVVGGSALYPLAGYKPAVYLAQTAVLADEAVVTAAQALPALHDEDVLVNKPVEETNYPNTRLYLPALTQASPDGLSWVFNLAQPQKGQLNFDQALVGKTVLLDGQNYQADVSLAAGTHTLTVQEQAPTIQYTAASDQVWHGCAPNQITPDWLWQKEGNNVTLRPLDYATGGCAILNLGMMDAGVYRFSVVGSIAAGMESFIEYDYKGVVERVNFTEEGGEQSFVIPLASRVPVSMIWRSKMAAGQAMRDDARTTIQKIGLATILPGLPDHVTITQPAVDTGAQPEVKYQVVSSREYRVELPARNESTYLVLSQAMNSRWRLEGITSAAHVAVNGGLNAWYIPAGGSATATIIYGQVWPYWVGITITLVTLISVIIVLTRKKQ